MIMFLKKLASAVATPASGKVTLFVDSASGVPSYKDDAGVVASLQGPAGQGVPTGGTAGQVLSKVDGADYNTAWQTPSAAARPVTALAISAGAVNIDLALGKHFTLVLTENVTSITFTNLPASGFAGEFALRIQQDATGGRTFAVPASFKATGGSDTAVASAANAVTLLTGMTFDQGARWPYAMQEVAA